MPLTIEWKPTGRNGTVAITAILDGKALHTDKLDLSRATARDRFAKALIQREPRLKAADVESKLLAIAQEVATPARPAVDEVDISAIVRPELFYTGGVAGVAMPAVMLADGQPVGKWVLLLRWADGRRERVELAHALELGDGRRIWFNPQPASPALTQAAGWSAEARSAWLVGAEPPEPVAVFRRICENVKYYVDFDPATAPGDRALIALWAMFTYIYPSWPAVPYLAVGGPLGSGKSRVFEVLQRLVFRPLASSNMTAPTLFRTIHELGGTLLLDEAERLRDKSPEAGEIRSILLSGYKRGGAAQRMEAAGDGKYITRTFNVYGPKALAAIAQLPEALASRCIRLTMFRAGPDSPKPRRRIDADPSSWQALRDDLHALALEHAATWPALAARADVAPAMSGRDYELWQPLLALCSWLQEEGADGLLSLMQEYAATIIDRNRDDAVPDTDELILRTLAVAVVSGTADLMEPEGLLRDLQQREPTAFKGWSTRGVSATLKRYGITATKAHGRRSYRDVSVGQLARIEKSYGMDLLLPEESRKLSGA